MNLAILRDNRRYVRLWTASAVSGLGSSLTLIAFPLLVLSLGGNATQAGAVASGSLITRLVLRLPGGHLADRFDRRQLMLGADLVRLVALGSIPLAAALHGPGYPQLLVVAAVEGAATALFGPASGVALRDVVAKERLTEAFAMNQARAATIDLTGPVIGGLLFGIEPVLPFTVDAISYAVSAALLLGLPRRRVDRTADRAADAGVTAGIRWLWRQPVVMRVLLFACIVNLIGAAAEILVVVSMRGHGTSSAVIGLVMACAGAGAIIGSVLAMRILRLLSSASLFVVTGVIWALGCALFATTSSPPAIAPMLVLMLLFAPVCGIRLGQITLGQAPAAILGRVNTAEQTINAGLASVGPLLAGVALQATGQIGTWSAMAAICVTATLLVAVPMLRAERRAKPESLVETST